jgi:DNA-binding NarL/FixJ family response regulator
METEAMKTVLVDDHALFRDGAGSLLLAWGHEVADQASDDGETIELVDVAAPDAVLMDVRVPNVSGSRDAAENGERQPEVAIAMLTVGEEEADLFRAIKAGAQGHRSKTLETPRLRAMLEGAARGGSATTPATAARIIDEFLRPPGGRRRGTPQHLTERELEVLGLVTDGRRNREIATELGISENTVKFHLKNIVEKLHAQNRAQLAAVAVREGLVPDPPPDTDSGEGYQRELPGRFR